MDTQNIKKINFGTKSQLAKLIASENITVQHNQVKTASFDTLNRILTLPIFKVQSGDVYDMLISTRMLILTFYGHQQMVGQLRLLMITN